MPGEDIEFRIKALEEDSRRNQETHREFFARFEKFGNEHARIDAQYANIMVTLGKLEAALEELKTNPTKRMEGIEAAIEEMKSKPAKRWDGIVDKLIWAVLAAVLGFVLAQIGIA